jgi:hypothetical protein
MNHFWNGPADLKSDDQDFSSSVSDRGQVYLDSPLVPRVACGQP